MESTKNIPLERRRHTLDNNIKRSI